MFYENNQTSNQTNVSFIKTRWFKKVILPSALGYRKPDI